MTASYFHAARVWRPGGLAEIAGEPRPPDPDRVRMAGWAKRLAHPDDVENIRQIDGEP